MGAEEKPNESVLENGVHPANGHIKENGVHPKSEKNNNGDETKEAKDDKKEEEPMVGFMEVFRYATKCDTALMILGMFAALIQGAGLPVMIIVFGETIDDFSDYTNATNVIANLGNSTNATLPVPDLFGNITTMAYYFIGIGAAVMIFGALQQGCFAVTAENQAVQIRVTFFRAVLRQNIGWFDENSVGELTSRMTDDINKIKNGIGGKIGNLLQFNAGALAGFIIGFIYGWKLTLVILAVSPLLVIAGFFMTKLLTSFTAQEQSDYAQAAAVAEQAISSIRTVTAFGGQSKESLRYESKLGLAEKSGMKKGLVSGGAMGVTYLIMFASYSLAFWYGSSLVRTGEYTPGDLLIVFFAVLIGAFFMGQGGPNFEAFAAARGAAFAVYRIIDRIPKIDVFAEKQGIENRGADIDEVASVSSTKQIGLSGHGSVQFQNVRFCYPMRKEVQILDGLSLSITQGQTLALVGSSGCGKSTVIQLLQRFYDVDEGSIEVDGKDVRSYQVSELRSKIGLVSQEPILFATTIEENIRLGHDSVEGKEVSLEDIQNAAKEANAHNFIMQLPEKYKTLVGERGAQLSGGQKQRIAIARALIRNPSILLLDEATSALDNESEKIVQEALDKVSIGRTTIIIAHRLSTIKNANVIASVKEGKVEEFGSHDELMANEGLYYQLVTSQSDGKIQKKQEDVEDEASSPRKMSRSQSTRGSRWGKSKKNSISVDKGGDAEEGGKGKEEENKKGEEEEEEEIDEEMKAEVEKNSMKNLLRLWKMNTPEIPFLILGSIGAICVGGTQPAFAIIFAEILAVFSRLDDQEKLVNFWSLMFLVLGIISGLGFLIMSFFLAVAAERLTKRIRSGTFKAILRQEISFFDDPKNRTGILCARLSNDATQAALGTGGRMSAVLQAIANMGTAIIIAFVYSWQMTLLIFAFIPFLALGGLMEMKIHTGGAETDKKSLEESSQTALEAVSNMRTVASIQKELHFFRRYKEQLEIISKKNIKAAVAFGASYGFSQGFIFFAYAGAFVLGAHLIENGDLDFVGLMKVFSALMFGAMALGQAGSFAPDAAKANTAAAQIFKLLDRESAIDPSKAAGDKRGNLGGVIKVRNAKFHYPTRPEVKVLQDLSFDVTSGQTVALVGSSGCGKSTVIQLLQRFYDPVAEPEGSEAGNITIDDLEVKEANVSWLREQMGLVSQEPVLFEGSIKDNILYGANHRSDVSMEEVIAVAKKANIHDFIVSLPAQYDTNVGEKGAQLSGGQKQRVAIARALVRDPKILLLDEATSALDTESEKQVQLALNAAQEGRTTIVIAHRLSTIEKADCILVIKEGRVVEAGKHEDLIAMNGHYSLLHSSNVVL